MSNAYKRYKRFLLPTANIARTDPLIHKMTSQRIISFQIFQKLVTPERIRPNKVCDQKEQTRFIGVPFP